MKIYVAKHGGFCFGVKRAIRIALDAAKEWKSVYSLGPLIHNQIAVDNLKKKGFDIQCVHYNPFDKFGAMFVFKKTGGEK